MEILPSRRDWPADAEHLAQQMADAITGDPIQEAALGLLLRAHPALWTDDELLEGAFLTQHPDTGHVIDVDWADLADWIGEALPTRLVRTSLDVLKSDLGLAAAAVWLTGDLGTTLDRINRDLDADGRNALVDAIAHACGVTR
jgi:hypothetical protein